MTQQIDRLLGTTKARARLFDDNILRGVDISVDTFGGDVTLTRALENPKRIEHATAIVKSVYGVRKANNLLMIKK
jgi:hyperosmotically inducible periplasmic protein